MGIGEAHPHAGQSIHLRRVKLGLVAIPGEVLIGAGIAHPHVISHHENDVGRVSGEYVRAQTQSQQSYEGGFHLSVNRGALQRLDSCLCKSPWDGALLTT